MGNEDLCHPVGWKGPELFEHCGMPWAEYAAGCRVSALVLRKGTPHFR